MGLGFSNLDHLGLGLGAGFYNSEGVVVSCEVRVLKRVCICMIEWRTLPH